MFSAKAVFFFVRSFHHLSQKCAHLFLDKNFFMQNQKLLYDHRVLKGNLNCCIDLIFNYYVVAHIMKLQTLVNFLRQELLIINSFFWLFSQFIFCCNISVLRRNEQDGVGLEDIDALQLELEALLSATVVRKLTLKEEVKILANIEKYRGQGKSFKRVKKVLASKLHNNLSFKQWWL